MKRKPASKSAFFNPRVLISLAFCLIGLFLALLSFGLFPSQSVLAQGPTQVRPAEETPYASDQPPDTKHYVRPGIPEDYAPGGRPAFPPLAVPSALVAVVRYVVVSNTHPSRTTADTFNDAQ